MNGETTIYFVHLFTRFSDIVGETPTVCTVFNIFEIESSHQDQKQENNIFSSDTEPINLWILFNTSNFI